MNEELDDKRDYRKLCVRNGENTGECVVLNQMSLLKIPDRTQTLNEIILYERTEIMDDFKEQVTALVNQMNMDTKEAYIEQIIALTNKMITDIKELEEKYADDLQDEQEEYR